MNVLVACEESQRVCIEFRNKGHNAYSCDLQECSGGHPEWHITGDVNILLGIGEKYINFITDNGDIHSITKWDLIIAHPPCTRLCSSGQRWLYWGDDEYRNKKINDQKDAIEFFMLFVKYQEKTGCKMAIENPVGIMSNLYRKPDVIYNPYDFKGETECKKTCLWLFGLPNLKPTQVLPKEERTLNTWKGVFNDIQYKWNDPIVAKFRSKTPFGVARAMAKQWG